MHATEKAFVAAFVQKPRRERTIFALSSPSRRGKFISRICHNFDDIFDARLLLPLTQPEDVSSLQQLLEKRGAGGTCHIISANNTVDGKQLPLSDAIQVVMGYGLPSILICAPHALAYFEAEQVQGPPPRYLLVKNADE